MTRYKSLLNPEIAKLIREKYPIVKNRTALWFFNKECQEGKHGSDRQDTNASTSGQSVTNPPLRKMPRHQMLETWNNMRPESKRKYFNMAEFDELRYKKQKSMWVAQIGSILLKSGGDLKKLPDNFLFPEFQVDYTKSLEMQERNHGKMVEAKSTRMLYKDVIKRADKGYSTASTEQLMSAVPEDYRPILTKPRRPPAAFLLFSSKNTPRLKKMKQEQDLKISIAKLATQEWSAMTMEEKQPYIEEYDKLLDHYNKALKEYREELQLSGGSDIEDALREKKLFKKSITRRLKRSDVMPVNVRNPFNFFVMHHKEGRISDMTKIWRDLPEEQKAKYRELSEKDAKRYYEERQDYKALMKDIAGLIEEVKA